MATVKSYQTDGVAPLAEENSDITNDLAIQTNIDANIRPVDSTVPEVLFSAGDGGQGDASGSSCFIKSFLPDGNE
jgi:hypothetical protein